MSVIGNTITALKDQLLAAAGLDYAHNSGYENQDVIELVQLNKYPFFNVVSDGKRVGPTSGLDIKDFERHTINIIIQLATRASKLNVALSGDDSRVGMYQFCDDVLDAIKADKTLSGAVNGYLPGSSIEIAVIDTGAGQDRVFVAGAEIRLQFYKDIGLHG